MQVQCMSAPMVSQARHNVVAAAHTRRVRHKRKQQHVWTVEPRTVGAAEGGRPHSAHSMAVLTASATCSRWARAMRWARGETCVGCRCRAAAMIRE